MSRIRFLGTWTLLLALIVVAPDNAQTQVTFGLSNLFPIQAASPFLVTTVTFGLSDAFTLITAKVQQPSQGTTVFGLSNEFTLNTFDLPLMPKTGDGMGSLGIGDQKTKSLNSVKPGQKVDIYIAFNQEITGATGFAVVLTFDPKKLSVVSGKGDGVFASAVFPGPPQIKDSTATYAGAFLGQTTTAKGPVAVLTFQTSSSFSGDVEIVLTTLTIRIPGLSKDFKPGDSVVISSRTGGAPSPDFDDNGVVDFDDFFQFASAFGKKRSDAEFDAKFDLDGNGEVDFNDFFIFADAFGKKI